jgi:hypothetical protein
MGGLRLLPPGQEELSFMMGLERTEPLSSSSAGPGPPPEWSSSGMSGFAAACGPERVEEPVERCRRVLDEAGEIATVAGHTRYSLARLEAKRGRFDDARQLADEARGHVSSSLLPPTLPALSPMSSCSGNSSRTRPSSSAAPPSRRRRTSPPSTRGCAPRGRAWLARHQPPDTEALAREAVGLTHTTDFLDLRGDCLVALADVRRRPRRRAGLTAWNLARAPRCRPGKASPARDSRGAQLSRRLLRPLR